MSPTVPELVAAWAAAEPGRPALVGAGRTLSYGELDRAANRLAHRLVAAGVRADVPVGLFLGRSAEFVVAALAVLKAGGAYLPLDPEYPPPRQAAMLAQGQPSVVVTLPELAPRLPAGTPVLELGDAAGRDDPLPIRPRPGDLAYVMFTSGSTGQPKGVMVPHRAITRLVVNPDYVHLGPGEVVAHLSSVSFDAATLEIWGALCNGARLVVGPPTLGALSEVAALVRRHGVTTMWLTAGLFHLMVDEHLADLAGVRQLLAGGYVLSGRGKAATWLANMIVEKIFGPEDAS